jgi:cysteinyl-tRNA synthetase
MVLKLYNTLSGTKEDFVPFDPKNVRVYVCGPTVYDFAHIGNARPVIVFDVLFRVLRHLYGAEHVTYVRNITDVDDKIILRAAESFPGRPLNEAIRKVTETTERQFHDDAAALGCLTPTVEPRATEHIAEMRAMIESLLAKGFAYVAEEHVLFSVASMPDYGKLSHRSLDDMLAGARVEVAPYKRDAMDFVLWKPSKPGEPAWPSPAGIATLGRPGWHIECSAMSDRWLWTEALPHLSGVGRAHPHQFDIHGGGIDLAFPHHENELAQSRSVHGTPLMAQVWMHNGFLQVEGKKMAKSEGNFVTIRELLKDWPGDVIRLAMLMTHYRQPLDWTVARCSEAYNVLRSLNNWVESTDIKTLFVDHDVSKGRLLRPFVDQVVEPLRDDLNTPAAITRLHQMMKFDGQIHGGGPQTIAASLLLLGFDSVVGKPWPIQQSDADVSRIAGLLDSRAAARKAKNFVEADRIRDELDAMGVRLKDSKDPKTGELVTTWEVKR